MNTPQSMGQTGLPNPIIGSPCSASLGFFLMTRNQNSGLREEGTKSPYTGHVHRNHGNFEFLPDSGKIQILGNGSIEILDPREPTDYARLVRLVGDEIHRLLPVGLIHTDVPHR